MRGNTERDFLHDISTPIANAMFVLEALLEDLGEHSSPGLRESAVSALGSLEEASRLIRDRRSRPQEGGSR